MAGRAQPADFQRFLDGLEHGMEAPVMPAEALPAMLAAASSNLQVITMDDYRARLRGGGAG